MALAPRTRATFIGKVVGHLPREMLKFVGSFEITAESLALVWEIQNIAGPRLHRALTVL